MVLGCVSTGSRLEQLPSFFSPFAYYHKRFGFDLTFCSGGRGQIHVRSGPGALLKIDGRPIRQTASVSASTHAAHDTVLPAEGMSGVPSGVPSGATSGATLRGVSSLRSHPSVRPSTPFRGKKKRWAGGAEETEPVQIHYGNHLEDSEKGGGGGEVGHVNRPWAPRSVTLPLSNMITAFVMWHRFCISVCLPWLFDHKFDC